MLVHRSNLNTVNTYVQEQNKTVTFTLWNCASGSPAPEMYSLSILHMGMGVNFSYLTRLNAIQVIVWSNLLRHSIVTTATCTRNAWPAHVSQKQRLRKRALREPYASCSHTEKQEMNRCTMSINRHLQKQTCTARCCGKRVTDTEPWSLFFLLFHRQCTQCHSYVHFITTWSCLCITHKETHTKSASTTACFLSHSLV